MEVSCKPFVLKGWIDKQDTTDAGRSGMYLDSGSGPCFDDTPTALV
jgi:hypothetical protein